VCGSCCCCGRTPLGASRAPDQQKLDMHAGTLAGMTVRQHMRRAAGQHGRWHGHTKAGKPYAGSLAHQYALFRLRCMMGSALVLARCWQFPPQPRQSCSRLATSSWEFRPSGGRSLAKFDQLPTRGSVWRGKCILAGDLVETPPVSGPKFRSAGRRPFQDL
jgi:hypothetical protein